ncbi:MAG TPA: hypothetical protein VF860_16705 [Candidatus Acidoferrales bacterium]
MHDRARSARFSRAIRRTFSPGFVGAGFLITALALLSPLANGQGATPPKPAAQLKIWKIAFDRAVLQGYYVGEAVHSDIFVMYSDRRGLRRVTTDGRSHGPVWSPDGSKLLFLHHKKEDSAVFLYPTTHLGVDTDIGILDSDRGEPLEESLGPGFIPQAAWSPDGKSVAVDFRPAPPRAWDKTGIYTVDLDRSDTPPLVVRDAYHFAWSPDGKKLAYVASREKKNHPAIYVSLADGSGEHRLTDPELKADDPAWSPDGRKFAIAVEHGIHGTPQGLYVMNDDGSDLKNLSGKKDHIQSPVWSPDGKRIAFLVGKDSDTQIFMVNADGSGLRQLTNERKSYCRHPSWSPDSKEIVFECGEHFSRYYYYNPLWSPLPKTDIYLLTVDEPDAKLTRLSQDGGSNPAFCPASFSRDEAAER